MSELVGDFVFILGVYLALMSSGILVYIGGGWLVEEVGVAPVAAIGFAAGCALIAAGLALGGRIVGGGDETDA